LREDGNAGARDRAHRIGKIGGAVQLDHVGTGFLDQTDGRLHGGVGAFLQRAEGEIARHEGALCAAPDRFADDDHFFHRHFERRGVAPQIDAHRVTDGDDVDAGAVDDLRNLVIPGDDADDLFAVALHLLKLRDRNGGIFGIHGEGSFPRGVHLGA
jgi:hypothetical protein